MPSRILIVKLSALGDLFHALPAVHAIKRALDARIDWLTQTEHVELLRCFTDVENVLPFYRHEFFRRFRAFARRLRQEEYDLVVDLQGLLKSAAATRLARGKRKVGPAWARESGRLLYPETAPCGAAPHAVERNLDVARYLGAPTEDVRFPVAFPRQALEEPRPRVAMLPVSRWPTKNWPAASFAETAKALAERAGASVFLIGAPADAAVCAGIERAVPRGLTNLCGKTSLVQLGSLLQELDLLISNDSGPIHMAAAVGTRVLALFGPTDPARTGPWGERHRVLTRPVECRPCLARTCRLGDVRCLAGLTPGQVIEAALDMLRSASG